MAMIAVAKARGVARFTLDRTDVLNSFNSEMARELQAALDDAREDDEVRAVLLTGAGRAFCAGQDLAEELPKDDEGHVDLGAHVRANYNKIVLQIRDLEKPVVCAVNGVAAGAGANLALACDLVLASDKASFVQAFCKIGLIPDTGGTYFLPRLIGTARATALMMLGNKVSAADAHAMGMIYKVCSADELKDEATKLAEYLATQPTKGLGLIKRTLNLSWELDLGSQLELEAELQRMAGQSEDFAEGVNAFLEKRAPQFKGK